MGNRLSRGSGPDQQSRQDAEIVAGDVNQIALVDILVSALPEFTDQIRVRADHRPAASCLPELRALVADHDTGGRAG